MTERPWVTPDELREYSEIKAVQNRTDARLKIDIARAEKYIITYTHNDFSSFDKVPEEVRTAVILLAEAYGNRAVAISNDKKSETFDDYSYTSSDSEINIDNLDIASLLDDYVVTEPKNTVNMRLRKL